jgi:hypothetical protein
VCVCACCVCECARARARAVCVGVGRISGQPALMLLSQSGTDSHTQALF